MCTRKARFCSFFYPPQDQNQLAKTLVNAVEIDAQNFIAKSLIFNKPVQFSTPNIVVVGVRLQHPTQGSGAPNLEDIDLTLRGVGVVIPGKLTTDLKQATVVTYSSLKDILSEVNVNDTADSVNSSDSTLTIKSTVVSFNTRPQLNSNVSEPFKIRLRNNQVRSRVGNFEIGKNVLLLYYVLTK